MLLGLSLCIVDVHSGAAHAAAPSAASSVELDEVEIIGRKQLKRELLRAQDRFFARYNELNTRKDFDIYCVDDARTGTRVPVRECRVVFLQRAKADMSREFLLGLTRGESRRYVNFPDMQWTTRHEEYFENARALLLAHPELLELAQKWGQLQQQYDGAQGQQK